ncbi:MAG: MBL fold metallo-hydrolase, partial [Actinobacteria bacterium]|nr:MBL fold metallo-hydrolase [Actinomycetota bacterium]
RIGSAHGIPDSATNGATQVERPDYMPLLEPPDFLVRDGETIDLGDGRSLHVVHTPGHEPAHICLRDSRTGILFSGDHILPRISPVIMYDLDLGDVLGDYLGSLQRLIAMDLGVTYPAHGTLIDQGGERARQILLHHDRRLLDMAELVRSEDTTAWNVMLKSFRPNLDPLQSRLAFLETISHLEHLRLTGRIRDEDRNGKVIYRA